jgi:hypothetical protein
MFSFQQLSQMPCSSQSGLAKCIISHVTLSILTSVQPYCNIISSPREVKVSTSLLMKKGFFVKKNLISSIADRKGEDKKFNKGGTKGLSDIYDHLDGQKLQSSHRR